MLSQGSTHARVLICKALFLQIIPLSTLGLWSPLTELGVHGKH